MIQYHPDNPFRPVNWRWERARLLQEGALRGLSRRKEDEWTLAALTMRKALSKCRDETDRYLVMDRNPSLYYAWLAHRPISDDLGDELGTPLRWAIEARLLAGESAADIGAKLGAAPAVVEWYERVFFNVSDRLQNPDYIMTAVISPTVHAGLTSQEYDVLWKVFGYLYGSIVLDSFIHGSTIKHHAETAEDADAQMGVDILTSIRRKAAICARTYTLNNFTQEGLMNIYARFLELDKSNDVGAAKDKFLSTINLVLNGLPFASGDGTVRPDQATRDMPSPLLKVDQPLLEYYDKNRAELRTDELLALTNGRDLPNRAELEALTFPEPQDASTAKTN